MNENQFISCFDILLYCTCSVLNNAGLYASFNNMCQEAQAKLLPSPGVAVYRSILAVAKCPYNGMLVNQHLPPQAVRAVGELPKLHSSILTTRSIQLSIWRKACRPDRTVVTLVGLELLLLVKVPHPDPSVVLVATTSNEPALSAVEGNTGQLIRRLNALDQRCRRAAVEEVDAFSSGHAQHTVGRGVIQLAGADIALDGVFANGGLLAQIPPANLLVFCRGNENVGV